MNFTFFDVSGAALFVRDDAVSAEWIQDQLELRATFPLLATKVIERMQRVGFNDDAGVYQCFEVYRAETEHPAGTQKLYASHIAVAELRDCALGAFTPTDATPASAMTQALTGTPWTLGTCTASNISSVESSYTDVWTAICAVRDAWGLRISPRVVFSGGQIAGKFLDVSEDSPVQTGLRLSLRRNVTKAKILYDDSTVKTALYLYGATDIEDGTESVLDVSGVSWSVSQGDPANKPAGQLYVEDTNATALYGRNGTPRFGVFRDAAIDDPEALLSAGWEHLQTVNRPELSVTATVADLYAFGYAGEPIALGAQANVELEGQKISAKVVRYTQNLILPEKSTLTLGNYIADIVWTQVGINNAAKSGATIAKSNPSLLQGYLNTMVTKIMSSGTSMYTDPNDGSLVFVSDDGASAVRITGGGMLLAASKSGGQWQWQTAITGNGIVADMVTSGTLQASLVRILGNANFFWDAAAITCQNPSNPQEQIRFGLYDGTNYGIGITTDGGSTWATSMDFSGVRAKTVFANGIQVGTINGQNAGYVMGSQIGSRTVSAGNLSDVYATQASFNTLQADVATIEQIFTGSAVASTIRTNVLATNILQVDGTGYYRLATSNAQHVLGTTT